MTNETFDTRQRPIGTGALRPLLWLGLVISVAGNMIVSFADSGIGFHLGFGLLSAAFGSALIAHHYRSRR